MIWSHFKDLNVHMTTSYQAARAKLVNQRLQTSIETFTAAIFFPAIF